MRNVRVLIAFLVLPIAALLAQDKPKTVYTSDNGDGTYLNPILYADYSDPDVIRVGDDFYMTASSFSHFPGLPILHSKDLVNWTIIGHAVPTYPVVEFARPQHGMAIWAPAIRYHDGEFFIYFGDPDRGVFMTKAMNPAGPWSPLRLIRKVTGWIDTCPFWDDDGNAYLVHAWANSRSGIKSILAMNRMTPDGMQVLDDGFIVFNGQANHPTMEGPKFYKRNDYYYIFAPAGGVKTGWQVVLRSRNIFGPYEDKIVLEQGNSRINGPHQGAWVQTQTGEDWFVHFQDRYAYGRIVHLQPMRWENDWPAMGVDANGNGIGEPVLTWKKPNIGKAKPIVAPATSDEFNDASLGLQWQWQSNWKLEWFSLAKRPGWIRLFSQPAVEDSGRLWNAGHLLLQKLPAPNFTATTKVDVSGMESGAVAGLTVFGKDYAYVGVKRTPEGFRLMYGECLEANRLKPETLTDLGEGASLMHFRATIRQMSDTTEIPEVRCELSFSCDGRVFTPLGRSFAVKEGVWVGAKIGLFAVNTDTTGRSGGVADVDWFRLEE